MPRIVHYFGRSIKLKAIPSVLDNFLVKEEFDCWVPSSVECADHYLFDILVVYANPRVNDITIMVRTVVFSLVDESVRYVNRLSDSDWPFGTNESWWRYKLSEESLYGSALLKFSMDDLKVAIKECIANV